jgi:transposase-like protein
MISRRTVTACSLEFKRLICEHYLSGNSSKEEIRRKFDIKGASTLLNWLRKLDYIDLVSSSDTKLIVMSKPKKRLLKVLKKRMKI